MPRIECVRDQQSNALHYGPLIHLVTLTGSTAPSPCPPCRPCPPCPPCPRWIMCRPWMQGSVRGVAGRVVGQSLTQRYPSRRSLGEQGRTGTERWLLHGFGGSRIGIGSGSGSGSLSGSGGFHGWTAAKCRGDCCGGCRATDENHWPKEGLGEFMM